MAKKEDKLEEQDEASVAVETEAPVEAVEETATEEAAVAEDTDTSEIELDKTVTVQPIKFASFEDLSQTQGEINKNLEILMDIKLQLTVELGRTELPIKKVLELTRGSIIELEKVAGEPVELYANGKLVAHGEVVVIEDNFGLRITSITEPEDRLKGIS
jgi:flagellar motor switch protein FliN